MYRPPSGVEATVDGVSLSAVKRLALALLVVAAATIVGAGPARAGQCGLPEATLMMTQCATYLATAPKSNTALTTYAAARKAVRERGALAVPKHLRNASTGLQRAEGGNGECMRNQVDAEARALGFVDRQAHSVDADRSFRGHVAGERVRNLELEAS